MAEVAGLVLGAVGLVGLIGAFKDTIELFSLITASQHFNQELLVTISKLDIEKLILLHWADRVRLLRTDHDPRLSDPTTQQGVSLILNRIEELLSDAHDLTNKYGLCEVSREESSSLSRSPTLMSSYRMQRFSSSFRQLRLTIAPRTKSTMANKVQWAIKDRDKFEDLLKELSRLTYKLNLLVPAQGNPETDHPSGLGCEHVQMQTEIPTPFVDHTKAIPVEYLEGTRKDKGHEYSSYSAAQIAQDAHCVANTNDLKVALLAAEKQKAIFAGPINAELLHREALCKRILNKIWFRMMDDRKESVLPAHISTLEWALHPPEQGCLWDDFSHWLQSGSGIYWVSGKAGSGKSTLIKHLYSHPDVPSLLSQWSGDNKCILISYFFYNLGTPMQKSQEGLLMAILHQALSAHQNLTSLMLPKMWRESELEDDDNNIIRPTKAEIRSAFEYLANGSEPSKNICFFIDGLDELEGDYMDIISFIQHLATLSPRFKIVASSRPIPECVFAFRNCPGLRLEDLNRGDITRYVKHTIGEHQYMKRLSSKYPSQAQVILDDLVEKSSGVFLWVVLACRSLISGFADYDRLPELHRRVDDLPRELWDLFDHMLRKINARHQGHGAKLLRTLHLHKKDERMHPGGLPITAMSMAMSEGDASDIYRKWAQEEKPHYYEEVSGRLRSRTGGLLEIQSRKEHGSLSNADGAIVEFMHRTVFEFLDDPKVWELKGLRISDDAFSEAAEISVLKLHGSVRLLDDQHENMAWAMLNEGFEWGTIADQEKQEGRDNIYWRIQPALNVLTYKDVRGSFLPRLVKFNEHDRREGHSHASLLLAVERGATNYVKRHPDFIATAVKTKFLCGCLPLLYPFVSLDFVSKRFEGRILERDVAMVRLLLGAGCSPNAKTILTIKDPWTHWLETLLKFWQRLDQASQMAAIKITTSFVEAGANRMPLGRSLTEWTHLICGQGEMGHNFEDALKASL
ncbi:hypothetical protein N8I77_000129 [Diaporthe amygdali]|uniref:NACHT domain-containing protein n=1 Tax=Phomopsis amygdali TaxID=1214568 RepID=A0AAD9W6T8_PHOAM|nr:hypothetical protein N8I77_000129 [Diaporthe amygdali]